MGVLILRCYIVHDGSGAGSAWSRGGRDLSGALLAVVVTLLLRCLGVRLGVVSERASTRQRAKGRFRVAGSGLGSPLDARFFVSAFLGQGSAFATGSRRERRGVRPRTRERRILGALCVGGTRDSPFSWHGPREGSIVAPSGPLGGASATCRALRRWQIHRRHARTQILALTPAPTRSPRAPTGAVASCPVEALSETRKSPSRASAAPLEHEAAPTQSHPSQKPHQRSRRSSTKPPRRSRRPRWSTPTHPQPGPTSTTTATAHPGICPGWCREVLLSAVPGLSRTLRASRHLAPVPAASAARLRVLLA